MINDLISRGALKKKIEGVVENEMPFDRKWALGLRYALKIIDTVPTAEERPQDDWIPVKYRPLTEKEKEEYPDGDFMYDCQLPDDGEEVIVTTRNGYVVVDTFCRGRYEGCYFECYCDDGDVVAWKPKPKPYKGGDEHGC